MSIADAYLVPTDPLDPLAARNPVIERLTGQQHNALRNESYYRVCFRNMFNKASIIYFSIVTGHK
jgi:hypothetical protein